MNKLYKVDYKLVLSDSLTLKGKSKEEVMDMLEDSVVDAITDEILIREDLEINTAMDTLFYEPNIVLLAHMDEVKQDEH